MTRILSYISKYLTVTFTLNMFLFYIHVHNRTPTCSYTHAYLPKYIYTCISIFISVYTIDISNQSFCVYKYIYSIYIYTHIHTWNVIVHDMRTS